MSWPGITSPSGCPRSHAASACTLRSKACASPARHGRAPCRIVPSVYAASPLRRAALAEAGDEREVPERITGREGEREGAVAKQVDGATERAVVGDGGADEVDRPVGGARV